MPRHMEFVIDWLKTKSGFKYDNKHYGFPVMTNQEKELIFNDPMNITKSENGIFEVEYSNKPQPEFCKDWSAELQEHKLDIISQNLRHAIYSEKFSPNGTFLVTAQVDRLKAEDC